MSAAVSLKDVQVAAGDRVLLDVPRLAIEQGERVAIVGPNGAGKSTLLKVIGALVEARQGRVEVLGRSLGPGDEAADRRALRRDTGLLMQGLPLMAMARNRYFMEPDGLSLDMGAFVAGLEYSAGIKAEITGKPAPS